MRGVKILIGLAVFGVLWIPSAYLGLHDIGKEVHMHDLSGHVSTKTTRTDPVNGNTYVTTGMITDTVSTFHVSCGSALFPVGGASNADSPVTKQVNHYPVQETRTGDPAASMAQDESMSAALANIPYQEGYTPTAYYSNAKFDSAASQLTSQWLALDNACHHDVSAARWPAFFACPIGWIVGFLGIGFLLSLLSGNGGGFDASITRDIFSGGWILRIWEK